MDDGFDPLRERVDGAPTWEPPPDDRYSQDDGLGGTTVESVTELIDPRRLEGLELPERDWVIDDWLPTRTVTLLPGPPGVGKSLLALQLQIAAGTKKQFLGLPTKPCKSLGFYCEDDSDELHRRGKSICIHYGVRLSDLELVRWQGRFSRNNILATFESGLIVPTELFSFLKTCMRETKAKLLILDNVAQLFGGNENDRSQVTQFVNLVGQLAVEFDAAVLLLAHPGKAEDGLTSQYSGSTAWDACVRCRWQFLRPMPEKGETAKDVANSRILRKVKSNYSSIGDEITMTWHNGAFVSDGVHLKDTVDHIEDRNVENLFLELLGKASKQGVVVNAKPRGDFAPKIFKSKFLAETKGIKVKDIEAAMNRLMNAGRLVQEIEGPPSHPRHYLREVQP